MTIGEIEIQALLKLLAEKDKAVRDAIEELWNLVDAVGDFKAKQIDGLHYIPIVDAVEIIRKHTKVGDTDGN